MQLWHVVERQNWFAFIKETFFILKQLNSEKNYSAVPSAQCPPPLAHYSPPGAQRWVDPESRGLSPSTEESFEPTVKDVQRCAPSAARSDLQLRNNGGGRKAEMLTLSSAWRGGGRWRFGALATPVFSEPTGKHMKGGLCRHVTSGCQQGCDEVRLVARGKEEEEEETGIEKFSYRFRE
ncbi:hypothetical protein EYF80_009554 [Liparis tanakae]|uniref:Uncharacterized protein n=1 Tax=Liparis tanakae TaxID=230148 RepID=A0A4Z2IQI9_9TELE|nr:hypothetical protein EYF80_009554 [Liparis tanakae]